MAQNQMNARILSFPSPQLHPIDHQPRGPGRLPHGVVSIKGKLAARRVKSRHELAQKQSELQDVMQNICELTEYVDKAYGLFCGFVADRMQLQKRADQLSAEISHAHGDPSPCTKTGNADPHPLPSLLEARKIYRALVNQVGG